MTVTKPIPSAHHSRVSLAVQEVADSFASRSVRISVERELVDALDIERLALFRFTIQKDLW